MPRADVLAPAGTNGQSPAMRATESETVGEELIEKRLTEKSSPGKTLVKKTGGGFVILPCGFGSLSIERDG
jgi:hypothetical protein